MSRRYLTPALPLGSAACAVVVFVLLTSAGDATNAARALLWGFGINVGAGILEFVALCDGLRRADRRCSPEAAVQGALVTLLLLTFGVLAAFQNMPSVFGPVVTGLVWAIVRCARVHGLLLRATPLAPSRPEPRGPSRVAP